MSSLCRVTLIGNLGKDPEIKTFQNGNTVATFSVATTEIWKDKDTGERKSKTEWHNCVSFVSSQCSFLQQYVRKGSKVYIEGTLKKRDYTTKDGQEKSIVEVVLSDYGSKILILDKKEDDSLQSETYTPISDTPKYPGNRKASSDIDDEIPF